MSVSLTAIESAKPLPEWIIKLKDLVRATRLDSAAIGATIPKGPKLGGPRKPSSGSATATTATGKVETVVKP